MHVSLYHAPAVVLSQKFGPTASPGDPLAVLRALRALFSLALLFTALGAAFTVKLGGRTFAEHMDRIGQTPEARDLVEGTRERVSPAVEDLRDRVLGEYVEAPTSGRQAQAELPPDVGSNEEAALSSISASTPEHSRRPGASTGGEPKGATPK